MVVKSEGKLVQASLQKTNAHGLARLVSETATYIRVLWLLAWLTCCCLFLWQLVGFIERLRAKEVTTSFQADHIPFEYPDLYFCYDNPMSGSKHLVLNNESAALINSSFEESRARLCSELDEESCLNIVISDLAEVQMNSLPYRLLVDELAHTLEQSIIFTVMIRSNGLVYSGKELPVTDFYHPAHLRCLRVSLNDTHRDELKSIGPEDALLFQLMMDAPDSRMGRSNLPVVKTIDGNLTAPFWALDKSSLASKVRDSCILLYITEPGHYPSKHDSILNLEAGRTYHVALEMKEHIHKEDPTRCVGQHPDVQIVNPYNNLAYTVAYDYAYCYNSAVQAQFKQEFGATCGYLPQPWPPTERLLFNLSSGWGSLQDIERYLERKQHLRTEEPLEVCETRHPCKERKYMPTVESVMWPSADTIETEFDDSRVLDSEYFPDAPGLRYLRGLKASGNATSQMSEYIRANFLQVSVKASKPKADQIIFNRAYRIESFVADVGGILGIYLGMSVLTACEFVQFVHDILLLCWRRKRGSVEDDEEGKKREASLESSSDATMDNRVIKF